jgi:hypothetical protein
MSINTTTTPRDLAADALTRQQQERSLIRARCEDEGVPLMGDIFGIVLDRGEVTEAQVLAFLALDDHAPVALYEHVVDGINRLSDAVQKWTRAST